MRISAGVLLLIATIPLTASAQTKVVAKNPSLDLERAPGSYHQRVAKFHEIIRKERNRDAKIKKAVALAANRRSPYRVDAINFLADIHAREAAPQLIALADDPNVQEFVLYALGEAPHERAVPTLINYLSDPNDNVRGNAYRALIKLTNAPFRYDYNATQGERTRSIEEIEKWWSQNKPTFKVREQTLEEKREAETAWEQHGRKYIEDLSR